MIGNLIGGIVSGYAEATMEKQKAARQMAEDSAQRRLKLITGILLDITDPSERAEAISMAEDAAGGPKKKGGDGLSGILNNLLGKYMTDEPEKQQRFQEFIQRPREVSPARPAGPPLEQRGEFPDVPGGLPGGLPGLSASLTTTAPGVPAQPARTVKGPFSTPEEIAQMKAQASAADTLADLQAKNQAAEDRRNQIKRQIETDPALAAQWKQLTPAQQVETLYPEVRMSSGLPQMPGMTPVDIEVNGKSVPAQYNRLTNQYLTLGGAPIDPNTITRVKPSTAGESLAEQKLNNAYAAYAEKYGTTPDKLTAQDKIKAEAEYKAALDAFGTNKSLQERLAALAMKPQLSPEDVKEKAAIEYAMGFVANQYGAGWKQMATWKGESVLQHPTQGQVRLGPGIRPPYTATERSQMAELDDMLGQVDILEWLATNNRGAIGWVQGKLAAAKRQVVGAGPEVNEMFRIADNLADQLLRARSGAQINEQEYVRLRSLVPNPRLAEEKFFSDLTGFKGGLERILARRSGAEPLVQNLPGRRFSVTVPGGKAYSFPTQEAADAFRKDAGIK